MRNLVLSCLESRVENNRSLYARFLLAPFENGNALTVGTALRRALLSQVKGIAITALDIQGITHEFCTIRGVRESVLELSLNFQQIVLRSQANFNKAQVGYLQVEGPRIVYANDLKLPLGVECVDPTQYIGTLSRDGLLVVKFLVGTSPLASSACLPSTSPASAKHVLLQPKSARTRTGDVEGKQAELAREGIKSIDLKTNNYRLSAKNIREAKTILKRASLLHSDSLRVIGPLDNDNVKTKTDNFGTKAPVETLETKTAQKLLEPNACLQNIIPLDSFITPVNRANFTIQVDELSNHARERLLLEVWTNGSIHPRQAIQSAVMSLVALFSEFRSLIHLDSHSLGLRTASKPYLPSKASLAKQVQINMNKRLSFLYKSNLDQMSLLDSDLSNLSLSLKTYSFLKRKGIHKLDTLLDYSSNSLLDLVNGNKNMFFDIKRCVSVLGLQFNDAVTR